jgi:DNA/RNA-binding domain of Phe-tRNA-synthetase-like protein
MDLGKLSELSIRRVCQECGAVFETTKEQTALEQFADHLTEHQPTVAQWTDAYNKIQASKEKKASPTGR